MVDGPHDHDQVDRPDLEEPDLFHDEEGNARFADEDLEAMAQFGAECWKAGVDPDEVALYLKGC